MRGFNLPGLLLGRWLENELREIVEPLLPMMEVMGVVIDVPDVRDVLFLQVGVNALADADQAVLVAARDVEKFQLFGLLRVRHEFRRWPGVRCGGEAADPGERVNVWDADVQGLPPAHRKSCDGAAFAIRFHGIVGFHKWNDVFEQIALEWLAPTAETAGAPAAATTSAKASARGVSRRVAVGQDEDHGLNLFVGD